MKWGGMVVRCVLGSGKGKCCCYCAFQLRLHYSDGEPRHKGQPSDKHGDTVIYRRKEKRGGSPIAEL